MNENQKIALMNVTHYTDFEDYQKHENMDSAEFYEAEENGFIIDITIGTYNGATQTTQYAELTDSNILLAILQTIVELDEWETLQDEDESFMFDSDYIRAFTEVYKVFTLNGQVFVNRD